MIPRRLSNKLVALARAYPVVSVCGPRQSGKTTLVKVTFPRHAYVSLEDLDTRNFAAADPRAFLKQYPKGVILDEVQRVPELFSYLQTEVDQQSKPGRFILTGSQQFLLLERVSQTLAGRAALLTLLPFSVGELRAAKRLPTSLNTLVWKGSYPRLYSARTLNPTDWYANYVQMYVERDVRQLKNISDLSDFQRLIRLCAARAGQLLNLSSLAEACGVTHNTVKAWLSILEASFIIYLLQPHHRNFRKRLVKMPKLYFYDTGLLCYCLGIRTSRDLTYHAMRGAIVENFVIAELLKLWYHQGRQPSLYFWRDRHGHEVDGLIEAGRRLIPLEIKASETFQERFLRDLRYWQRLSGSRADAYVVYGGAMEQRRSGVHILPWDRFDATLEGIIR
ncbi:MAG: ATP-binding protein [Candidatus Omnitrophica bacterium]|nr:ATP-binding protein [Candidatus Omnitrophota bacterium]